jgi:alpha-galactosidase
LDNLAPDALILNYVNPMAVISWAVREATGHPYVGLCHSVQGTSEMLAEWIGVPCDEVAYLCAGITQIRAMVGEMLAAQARWLPQFQNP